jgi:tagatose 1,6-diphosphate aldolase
VKTRISRKLFENLQANATPEGVIAAAAMDQRGSLKRALEKAGATNVGPGELSEFKSLVVAALSPHASAFLLDPNYGMDAVRERAPGCGALLAYEKSGYDETSPGRQPDLLPGWSAQRLAQAGATGVKVLVYYNPADDARINDQKHAFVERVGAECETVGLPLFLEPVMYDDGVEDPREQAKLRPARVRDTMAEFSRPHYRVSVLKVEFPVDPNFTSGLIKPVDGAVHDVSDARHLIREAADASRLPFIYLSAGVDMEVFTELLEISAEVGSGFNGVLCGRATWKGAIPAYARSGPEAMRGWLEEHGAANIRRLNEVVFRHASPWWDAFGGREGMEVIPS